MKPFQLLHLLRHLTDQTLCPHCKAKLFEEHIRVDATVDGSAFLTVHCEECQQNMNIHVYVSQADRNALKNIEKKQSEISPEEINLAHTLLKKDIKNISELFPKEL
jgi:hypothetical protein